MKTIASIFTAIALVGVLCVLPSPASASTIYNDYTIEHTTLQASFLTEIAGLGLTPEYEYFDNPPHVVGDSSPITSVFPSTTATITGVAEIVDSVPTGAVIDRAAISGTQWLEVSTDDTTGQLTISFADDVSAFGFYGMDIGDFGGSVSALVTFGDGSTANYIINTAAASAANGDVIFFGLVDDVNLISQITFTNQLAVVGLYDDFGIEDLIVAKTTPVPEPSAFILFGLGLAGLAAFRRLRR